MDLSKFSRGGGDFTPAPAGVHNAVCVQVIDLGTQQTAFLDEKTGQPKHARQIRIAWEIDEVMESGNRFLVSKTYAASMNEKANLRKDLESWRGVVFKESDFAPGGFSLRKLLGAGCQLSIVDYVRKDGKASTRIGGVMKLAKGQTKLEPQFECVLFDLDEFDRTLFESLSPYLKETIEKSPEYRALSSRQAAPPAPNERFDPDLDDEIPF